MQKFTPTDVQRRGAELYNEVQASGRARITHTSRPDMVVMTIKQLEQILHSPSYRNIIFDELESDAAKLQA